MDYTENCDHLEAKTSAIITLWTIKTDDLQNWLWNGYQKLEKKT